MSDQGNGIGPLLVVTALADEARAFFRGTDGGMALRPRGEPPSSPAMRDMREGRDSLGEVVWVGPGSSGEGPLFDLLISGRFSFVLFTGLAGALSTELAPGSIVVADEVVTAAGECVLPERTFPWDRSRFTSPGTRVHSGRILSATTLIGSPEEKGRMARETGAVAVDMESGLWLTLASRAGIPAAVVRVISDGARETLPPEILSFVDASGSVSYRGIMGALLSRPALLFQLVPLWPSIDLGRKTLTRMGSQVSAALREGRR